MTSVITDAEFWTHIRLRNASSDCIFRSMLKLLHARQAQLAGPISSPVSCDSVTDLSRDGSTDATRGHSAALRQASPPHHAASADRASFAMCGPVTSGSSHIRDRALCASGALATQTSVCPNKASIRSTLAQEEFVLFEEGLQAYEEVSATPATSGELMKRQATREQRAQELIACRDDAPIEPQRALLSCPHCPARRVAPVTVRVLQQVMLFAVPIYALRYNIPAMSMSWNCSSLIRYASKDLVVFGVSPAAVQRNTRDGDPEAYHQVIALPMGARGVVVGSTFIALLSYANEVWVTGKMDAAHRPSHMAHHASPPRRRRGGEDGGGCGGCGPNGVLSTTSSHPGIVVHNRECRQGNADNQTSSCNSENNTCADNGWEGNEKDGEADAKSFVRVADRALMLTGHGDRLACVAEGFTVSPLSLLSTPIHSIMPPRRVRFIDLGYGEDYFMISVESVLYKTTASKRAVGTPRRVMSMCRGTVSRVASGSGFALVIDQSGLLITIGRNKCGQLGLGHCRDARRLPFRHMDLSHHFFVQVAAGDRHSLALTSSGVVYGAGSNEVGQLGMGETQISVHMFMPIDLPCRCVGIAAGPAGSMFACEDGTVWACGANGSQQLGMASAQNCVYRPTPIPNIHQGIVSYVIEFGAYHAPRHPSPGDHPAQRAVSAEEDGRNKDKSNSMHHPTSSATPSRRPEVRNEDVISPKPPSATAVAVARAQNITNEVTPVPPLISSIRLPSHIAVQGTSQTAERVHTVPPTYPFPCNTKMTNEPSTLVMGYSLNEPLAGLHTALVRPDGNQSNLDTTSQVVHHRNRNNSPTNASEEVIKNESALLPLVGIVTAASASQPLACVVPTSVKTISQEALVTSTPAPAMPPRKPKTRQNRCCNVM